MSEQTANGRRFRLYEIILGVVLVAMFAMLFASTQRLINQMDEIGRQLDEVGRKLDEIHLMLVEMQTTLNLIASGLNIRVEPKEQAGPAATPTPNEKLATKAP